MSTLLASRVARRVGWIVGLIVGTVVGCCGGGPTHKCDFTPPPGAGPDAGSDGPMLCGTQVCDTGKVCCYTKAPPLANCIDPEKFQSLGCEKLALPCLTPAECPDGTVCCLNITDPTNYTVSCQSTLLCQANGAGTRWACGSSADCPRYAPDCANVARLDDGRDFNICVPATPASP
jgi:hypothetical protein